MQGKRRQNKSRGLKAEQEVTAEWGHCGLSEGLGCQTGAPLVNTSPLVTLPYCEPIWFARSEHYTADFLKPGPLARPYWWR